MEGVSVSVDPGAAWRQLSKLMCGVANDEIRGMGHSACLEELDDVESFLGKQLPPKGDAAAETGKSEL